MWKKKAEEFHPSRHQQFNRDLVGNENEYPVPGPKKNDDKYVQ
jgi:hypothetical protein